MRSNRVLKNLFGAQAVQKDPDARPQATTEPERTEQVREDSGEAENAADGLFQQPANLLLYLRLPLTLLGLLIFTVSSALADDPSGLLIQGVIQQQLKAFSADDYPSAYRHASKQIQSKFTPDEFKAMVRTGYPQIAKSLRAVFGEIRYSDDRLHATAQVDVTGTDLVTVRARYRMVMEDDWKIDGVILFDRTTPI
jgi:hypothetical protein